MIESTGVVLSVRPVWLRTGDGRTLKHLRLRVEYEDRDGTRRDQFQVPYRPGVRIGSTVAVVSRTGRDPRLHFPDAPAQHWWRPPQVRSGLLAYAGILVVLLLFGGVVLGSVMYGSGDLPVPPPGFNSGPAGSVTPAPSGSVTPGPSGSAGPSASGVPSPGN